VSISPNFLWLLFSAKYFIIIIIIGSTSHWIVDAIDMQPQIEIRATTKDYKCPANTLCI